MNRTTLVVGVVIVTIIILVGIIANLPNIGRHSVSTPPNTLVSLPFTTTITNQSTSSTIPSQTTTTQSSTTSTTTHPSQIQSCEIYFLNHSDGVYWYVAVFSVSSMPYNSVSVTIPYANGSVTFPNVSVYHLYGYSEILLPLKQPIMTTGAIFPIIITFVSGGSKLFPTYYYGYNWTYGNL